MGRPNELWAALATIPERSDLRPRIFAKLKGAHKVLVFEDVNHVGVWPNARRILWYDYPPQVSHVMLLQDDIYLCEDFIPTVWKFVRRWPNNTIVPFSPWTPERVNGTVWRTYNVSGQCFVWPVEIMKKMRAWIDEHVVLSYRSFDRRVATWAQLHKHKFILPRYSLILHDTAVKSSMGHTVVEGRYFLGETVSGLSVDWYEGDPPTEKSSDELRAMLPYLKGDYRVS